MRLKGIPSSVRLDARLEGTQAPVRLEILPSWRQTLASIASILSVLTIGVGLIYTNNAARNQLAVAEQGQITDRFGRATEQLGQEGDDKLGIRLGGIYALERLMADSVRDESAIIEVLCAFVRTHAVAPSTPPSTAPAASSTTSASPIDVQAAVTVLARRPRPTEPGNARIDLTNTRLGMPEALLPGAYLAEAYLKYANLDGADLRGAHLEDAMMVHVTLPKARLDGAWLSRAKLDFADLREADLRGTHLDESWLLGADLSNARLDGADLKYARLSGADLKYAHLEGADLRDAIWMSSAQVQCSYVDSGTRLPEDVVRPMEDAPFKDPACRQ